MPYDIHVWYHQIKVNEVCTMIYRSGKLEMNAVFSVTYRSGNVKVKNQWR